MRITYRDYITSFQDLLIKDNSYSIHYRSIQKLATEIFKVKNGFSNGLLNEFFDNRSLTYNLRNPYTYVQRNPHTTRFGINSLSFYAPKVWNILPPNLKSISNVAKFKTAVKKWTPENCSCRLCSF